MKKSLLVVVVLLCMASILAALAYNNAYVQNPTLLKVVSTEDALVAIKPGTGLGNYDETAEVVDGVMHVNFGRGLDRQMFGLQPGSGYTWNNLFTVTNNSSEPISYRFTVSGNISPHITITENEREGNSGGLAYKDLKAGDKPIYRTIEPGEELSFKVHIWNHQNTKLEDLYGTIQVNTYARESEGK